MKATVLMSKDTNELFWTLLDLTKYEQLKSCTPEDFCWDTLNPNDNTSILVSALKFPTEWRKEADVLDLIEWLIKSGASVSQECGASSCAYSLWKTGDEQNTKLCVRYRGHTVLSYIQAWRNQIASSTADFKQEQRFLSRVIDRIAAASCQRKAQHRVTVHEGVVDIWEKSLRATASHDLTIEAVDGQVTAHAHMLMAASPVVQAMLKSPMKEAASQHIQLHDTQSSAVTLLLEALYTSSSLSDPGYKTVLSALDLAHRWQIEVVVRMLADLVGEMITKESFPAIAEHAALKNLGALKTACRQFGSECDELQEKIKQGHFSKAVQDLFHLSTAPPPVKKPKRL